MQRPGVGKNWGRQRGLQAVQERLRGRRPDWGRRLILKRLLRRGRSGFHSLVKKTLGLLGGRQLGTEEQNQNSSLGVEIRTPISGRRTSPMIRPKPPTLRRKDKKCSWEETLARMARHPRLPSDQSFQPLSLYSRFLTPAGGGGPGTDWGTGAPRQPGPGRAQRELPGSQGSHSAARSQLRAAHILEWKLGAQRP